MGDSQMGVQARLMSQALRKLTAIVNKSKTIVIFVNQIRDKIGVMFGNPEVTPGGRALKFYSSIRVDIRRIESVKSGVDIVGNKVKVKIVKNKVAPPFRFTELEIIFGEGISRESDILDLAIHYDLVEKSGAWFSYQEQRMGQGRDAAKKFLKDNPKAYQELEVKIKQLVKDSKPVLTPPNQAKEELILE